MEKKALPENGCMNCGKHSAEPVAKQQELLTLVSPGWVCEECLNEDFDTCVCPEPPEPEK